MTYDWIAPSKSFLQFPNRPIDTLIFEMKSWSEIEHVWREFWSFHFWSDSDYLYDLEKQKAHQVMQELESEVDQFTNLSAESEEFNDGWKAEVNKLLLEKHWQSEQIINFYSANAGAEYRKKWELCTKAERI